MKKNLISVIILALVLANFVLTALLVFTVLPETKQANKLIEEVCSAIDLELNSGAASGVSDVPIDQIETFQIKDGETMTVNLKTSDDGSNHYAVLAVSLSLNTKSDNYKTYSPEVLETKEELIKNDIIEIIGKYTVTEFNRDADAVKNDILKDMQNMFGKDYIVGVNFSELQSE